MVSRTHLSVGFSICFDANFKLGPFARRFFKSLAASTVPCIHKNLLLEADQVELSVILTRPEGMDDTYFLQLPVIKSALSQNLRR